jgi:hypothetical protein
MYLCGVQEVTRLNPLFGMIMPARQVLACVSVFVKNVAVLEVCVCCMLHIRASHGMR